MMLNRVAALAPLADCPWYDAVLLPELTSNEALCLPVKINQPRDIARRGIATVSADDGAIYDGIISANPDYSPEVSADALHAGTAARNALAKRNASCAVMATGDRYDLGDAKRYLDGLGRNCGAGARDCRRMTSSALVSRTLFWTSWAVCSSWGHGWGKKHSQFSIEPPIVLQLDDVAEMTRVK
ncbi:hypothetical protein MKZ38_003557 [Zalerion maritima]|uniref:Uncharacterized protein n=1 Tax=Zalerion maritima TaxID=339359 RepID=A0AAD5RMW1_9PEZI|nr:hypothetical protein MKZ38_003557 [Zalerion maritima]